MNFRTGYHQAQPDLPELSILFDLRVRVCPDAVASHRRIEFVRVTRGDRQLPADCGRDHSSIDRDTPVDRDVGVFVGGFTTLLVGYATWRRSGVESRRSCSRD